MRADPIWENRQAKNLLWSGGRHALPDGIDDQGVGAHGQVVGVLLGVPNRQHDDLAALVVRREISWLSRLAGVEQADLLEAQPQVQVLGCEQVDLREAVLTQAIGQVVQ